VAHLIESGSFTREDIREAEKILRRHERTESSEENAK
jgi:hypothetical protein